MASVATTRIESLAEVLELLLDLDRSDRHHHYRSDWIYRGMTDASWAIRSGLDRLGGHARAVEKPLLRNFRRYSDPDCAVDGSCFWNDLAVAQHHGLPTRLIDWTNSPLIALHFAVGSCPDPATDGVLNLCSLRTINLLPDRLRGILQQEDAYVFTSGMLDGFVSLEQFDELRAEADFILILEPPALDSRITNQYAMLTVLPSPTESVTSFLDRHPHYGKRLVIPGELKWEIRDKLDQMNVTERMLFPGLDGLASWLRRYYSDGRGASPGAPTSPTTSMWD